MVHDGGGARGLPRARERCVTMAVEAYVVLFVAFYERGFDTPSHWFLRSLL
jgi:hypothetical protein